MELTAEHPAGGPRHSPSVAVPSNGHLPGVVDDASPPSTEATQPLVLADTWGYALAKRTLDIVVALLVLIVFSPVMLVIALLIRRDSPGPAIFRQDRVARGQRVFRFFKFRTMRADAKSVFPELCALKYDPEHLDRVFLQVKGDPRVTNVGRWLRRTSLDELPNFWNVLIGDISLVGPRPEVPEMIPYYEGKIKFAVRPGVTGLAQISGRGNLNFLETIRYDEEYVRRRSFWFDLRILSLTLIAVFTESSAVGY